LDALLKAISDLGYQPSRHGPIVASAKSGNLAASVVQKSKLQRTKKGKLELKLTSGYSKADMTITASNDALGIKATHEGKVGKKKTVSLEVEVPEGATAGDHELTVVIRVGEEELSLKVPVQIE